jgi:tRNA dimethylallyltransferase
MYYHYGMIVGVLCGATASGKSALALKIAEANGFEIISADSRQIYRGFTIGTNAPRGAELAIPHHLVGFLDPGLAFSPRAYPGHVHDLVASHPHINFLIVGGTGLYLKELIFPSPFDRGPTPDAIKAQVQSKINKQGLAEVYAELLRIDPEGTRGIHPNDIYRIAKRWENFLITGESYTLLTGPQVMDKRFEGVPMLCLDVERTSLYARIDARVKEMFAAGWMDEVKQLMTLPDWESLPAFSSLGYREIAAALVVTQADSGTGILTGTEPQAILKDEVIQKIQMQTRNYAKRQVTFFNRQLPGLQHWDANLLTEALISCNWSWKAFLDKHLPLTGKGVEN